jgi:hypothetical protein
VNHYEELGIHSDATTGEIREAYKLAARLLHPDLQRDPRLKDLAECQMRRLSDVVAVLVDPQARANYDASLLHVPRVGLLSKFALAPRPELLQAVVRHWLWVLLGAMTIGMGVWYGLSQGTYIPPGSARAESPAVPVGSLASPGPPAQVLKPRVQPPAATPARPVRPLLPLHPPREEPDQNLSAILPTPADAPSDVARAEPGRPLVMPKPAPVIMVRTGASRFDGEWLYSADGSDEDAAGAYPAKYVEFRLRQEGGVLTGDYRALHKVFDKAISPEVVFHVRGASPGGNSGKLDWESSSGAKGELDLTLRPPNQLQVRWWTTQFGRQEALGSGTAVLVRLETP